ncbi:pyridoxal phosphate-dependent aminotransferase [Pigmentibacter ruber]|nr:pyridoxal phosphate-dependent aminotransferase [Pigmentibacter ruber]
MGKINENQIDVLFSKKFLELSNMGGEIRKIFMLGQNLKQKNSNIELIDLSLGNPDLEPPIQIKNLLIHLLNSNEKGSHRYMDSAGLPEVREFLANELSKSEKVKLTKDNIFLTVGAAGAIQIVFRTFLDINDEVIIFTPYFPEYIPYTGNCGAKPVFVKCDEFHQPNIEDFEKKISDKTKIVLINSPNNPTGISYKKEKLIAITNILNKHNEKYGRNIQLVADEPYARVLFNEGKQHSLLEMYKYTWLIRSFSKDLGLAGERIGYLAWRNDPEFEQMQNTFRQSSRVLGFVSAPRLMQRLIPLVYNTKVSIETYQKRVDSFVSILKSGGISVQKPDAGFFVFPKCPIADDKSFCEDLVQLGVLCVPGSGFGQSGYFRASLTQDLNLIESAAHKIISLIKSNNYV